MPVVMSPAFYIAFLCVLMSFKNGRRRKGPQVLLSLLGFTGTKVRLLTQNTTATLAPASFAAFLVPGSAAVGCQQTTSQYGERHPVKLQVRVGMLSRLGCSRKLLLAMIHYRTVSLGTNFADCRKMTLQKKG